MSEKSAKKKFKELQKLQKEMSKRQENRNVQSEKVEVSKVFKKKQGEEQRSDLNSVQSGRVKEWIGKISKKLDTFWSRVKGMENYPSIKRWSIIGSCVVLVALVGWYSWQGYYYRDKFFRGTTINQVSCDGLKADQVENLLRESIEKYKISIEFRDGVTESILGNEIDYRYISDGTVERLLKKQNPVFWLFSGLSNKKHEIETNIEYDVEKLEDKVKNLDSMKSSNQVKPTDAYVEFTEDSFEIKEETYGTAIKQDVLLNALEEAVAASVHSISAEEADVYEKPSVYKDDEGLKREKDQLNELAKVSITYELPNSEEVLNGNTVKDWLELDENGNFSKNEDKFRDKVKEYVEKLAESVDTVGKPRPFHTTSGLDVNVEGGKYGWKIDQKKECELLLDNIENQIVEKRKPEYVSEEKYTENHGIGTTYIEVNLSEQHLYYYQDGKVVLDTPIVSGKMTRDRYTPAGVFFLTFKQRDAVLRGQPKPEGGYTYESPVAYWMPFNGGIGLHDADGWRSSYGGSIYVYRGSHGCINMPRKAASKIYEMIDKQTPIICVYNEKYNLYG